MNRRSSGAVVAAVLFFAACIAVMLVYTLNNKPDAGNAFTAPTTTTEPTTTTAASTTTTTSTTVQTVVVSPTETTAAPTVIVSGQTSESEETTAATATVSTTKKKTGEKIAYLTFDDGPSENTEKLLDILDKYDVKATFFVIGKKGLDKQYKAIADRGHTIALHSYTHTYSAIYKSEKGYFDDLQKISDKVYNLTGVRSHIVRFPGGSSNTKHRKYCKGIMKKLAKSLAEKGYVYHDWNVDSGDATGSNVAAEKLLKNVKNDIGKNEVIDVLMHDTGKSKKTTVEALPSIIEYLKSKGFKFARITDDTEPIQHKLAS